MKIRHTKFAASLALAASLAAQAHAEREILNASFDISRELFAALNPVFVATWKAEKSEDVVVKQTHQGSSKQARAIIEGLPADVVTFNQDTDVQLLHDEGNLIPADWRQRLPDESSPYYSLTSFLVRGGNPKGIKDWDDLARPGVSIVFPNPKTSGNGRATYLAAWAWAKRKTGSDEKAREFVGKIVANVAVFDAGGRGATTTFVERGVGDVLVTFEAETLGIRKQSGGGKFEIVTPSLSLAASFPVSVVDAVVDRRGTRDLATGYLEWLYSEPAQEILAEHFYRVRSPEVAKKFQDHFPQLELLTVEEIFGSWESARQTHFSNGGVFDQLVSRQ